MFRPRMFRTGLCVAGVLLLCLGWSQPADARKTYLDVFVKSYPNLGGAAREAKCDVCHVGGGAMKRNRNNYGRAMADVLGGKKNLKEDADIAQVLKGVEGETSAIPGKTFGELIQANDLPAKQPGK